VFLCRCLQPWLCAWQDDLSVLPSCARRVQSAEKRQSRRACPRDRAGNRVVSLLETGEGYRLAAAAAVRALGKLLAIRPVGALTPAQAFGADFALSLPETQIRDL